jgi:hypothetical protein
MRTNGGVLDPQAAFDEPTKEDHVSALEMLDTFKGWSNRGIAMSLEKLEHCFRPSIVPVIFSRRSQVRPLYTAASSKKTNYDP